jgi:hypothetical protein
MSNRLQTITAKVHFEIKEMVAKGCKLTLMNESQYLNYYLEKAMRMESEIETLSQENAQITSKLTSETALNKEIKESESAKTLAQKEVEIILNKNEAILRDLFKQHAGNKLSGDLIIKNSLKTAYFTHYRLINNETVYCIYNYGFKKLKDNQFIIVKLN